MGELVHTGSKYSDSDRLEAIRAYAITGNYTKTAELVGIPERTVNDWGKQEWWESELAKVRDEKQQEHIAQYHALVTEGTRIALEKLPEASAKDAMIIAATATDKARLLLNQPTSISGRAAGMDELAKQFAQLSAQWEEKQVRVIETVEKRD